MKRLILFMVLATVFPECGQDSKNNPLTSQEINADCRTSYALCDIMPLTVGNNWTYQTINYDSLGGIKYIDTSVITITRDTVINDEVW